MTEPVTTYKTLIVPNTGDLTGAWGTSALNPNFQLIDAMFGGVTTLSLGAATTITLSVPATTGIWGGSVPQSSNAMIRLTGTLSGQNTCVLTLPGFYIVDAQFTPTDTFGVVFSPAVGTLSIGIPYGRKTQIFYDGSSGIDFVDMGFPGEALDLHGYTTFPKWMADCTNGVYLLKDGSSRVTATYPALAWALRGAFGNPSTPGVNFTLPDERARARIAYDSGGSTGRLTTGISGIDGGTMGSGGGDQSLQSHQHANTLNDPGHLHSGGVASQPPGTGFTIGGGSGLTVGNTATATTGISITNVTTGAGGSQNVQPSIVSFLPLIKT